MSPARMMSVAAWVIWPIFSSSVIRPSRSATRASTSRLESRYTTVRGVGVKAGAVTEAAGAQPASRRKIKEIIASDRFI